MRETVSRTVAAIIAVRVPHWPDPTIDAEGRPGFAISIGEDGFDPDSQFGSQQEECGRRTGSPAPRAVSP